MTRMWSILSSCFGGPLRLAPPAATTTAAATATTPAAASRRRILRYVIPSPFTIRLRNRTDSREPPDGRGLRSEGGEVTTSFVLFAEAPGRAGHFGSGSSL